MVLVSSTSKPQACVEFVAEIYLSMHHTNTSIRKGFESTVQIENIQQTALIIEMDKVRFSSIAIDWIHCSLVGRLTCEQTSYCDISVS